jgi:hypothetical protein
MVKRLAVALALAGIVALMALSAPAARAQGEATPTYTPIATRAASGQTYALDTGEFVYDQRITSGDVLIIVAVGGVLGMCGLWWAYTWVQGHIRVQE